MSQIPVDSGVVAPPSVEVEIPCRKCGYNLRGLLLDGRCPECATPVGVSISGELLRYSDPEFVWTLRRGIGFILWGTLGVIVLTIVAAILGATGTVNANSPVFQLVGFIGGLPIVIGGWLLTAPDPSGIGEERYGTARKVIRISLTVGLLDSLLTFVAQAAAPLPPALHTVFIILEGLTNIIGLVGTIAQLAYLKKLALRIPDAGLSERANTLIWGFGISLAMLLVLGFITGLSGGLGGTGSPVMFLSCGAGIAGLAAIVFAVMYLFMLGRFGRHFRDQTAIARQLWSAAMSLPHGTEAPS